MHVGMNRVPPLVLLQQPGVPHARGDEPDTEDFIQSVRKSSPCTWG